jgi:hypothetical protein
LNIVVENLTIEINGRVVINACPLSVPIDLSVSSPVGNIDIKGNLNIMIANNDLKASALLSAYSLIPEFILKYCIKFMLKKFIADMEKKIIIKTGVIVLGRESYYIKKKTWEKVKR